MRRDSKSNGDCGDDRLRLLLESEEQSAAFVEAARHVEHCPACRRRLMEMEAALVADLRRLLADCGENLSPEEDGPANSGQERLPLDSGSPDLGFLAPGSHPEMLGRLGRYEVERVIGSGGMGVVLKAHDMELNRPVAIKVLAAHLIRNGTARQRFAREGRAAAAILHENVVAIHNVESEGQTPYLVMQYIDGQSLQTRVDEHGPLHFRGLLRIGMQAAAGLAAAHAQGLVHRDVKPSNILLEGDLERVFLTDFGLARAADDVTLTGTGLVAGTPNYMSPEQARGEAVDGRSDLFSLGASLYFAATGRPPFRAEGWVAVVHRICHYRQAPVCKMNPEMPIEVSAAIDRLLQKQPRKRFASAEALRQRLADLLVRSQRPGRLFPARPWRGIRRIGRGARLAAALAALLLAAGGAWLWSHQDGHNRDSRTQLPAIAQQPIERPSRPAPNSSLLRVAAGSAALEQTLALEWANTRSNLTRRLDEIEAENNAATFATRGSSGSSWEQQLGSVQAEVSKLESEWSREAQREAQVRAPDSSPIAQKR